MIHPGGIPLSLEMSLVRDEEVKVKWNSSVSVSLALHHVYAI